MNKKKIIRVNESQLKNYIKKLINEEINNEETDEKEDFGVNALTGEPLPNPNDQIVHEEVGEKTKNTIDKWRSELGDMKTAVKLVDYMLEKMIGMSSSDLADTATFANGLEAIVEELESGNYKSAINLAGDTAKEMIDEEGFGDMFEGVNVSKTNKKDGEGRPIYKSEDGKKYVDVSLGKSKKPELHSVTKEGEPNTPLKNFVIKEEESFMKMRAGTKGKVFENEGSKPDIISIDKMVDDKTFITIKTINGETEQILFEVGDLEPSEFSDYYYATLIGYDKNGIQYGITADYEMFSHEIGGKILDLTTNNDIYVIKNNDSIDNIVNKYDNQESGKYTQNMDDVESGILPEKMNQELNETIKRFKKIINY